MLEIAEVIEVETDENSHDLSTAHSPFTLSMLDAVRLLQSQFCYFNIKFLARNHLQYKKFSVILSLVINRY
uniref:hypothetical protein n=1 Tax=Hoylesella timonensis TaxID=386414 RepID=UPI001C54FCF5